MTATNPHDLSAWTTSPDLYLFTSLTSGSSHIFTATSRLETILRANRIPFKAVDLATDESARRLWQRRAGKDRKLPGLVKEGFVVGDVDEVEEWNEFGELREVLGVKGPVAGVGKGSAVAGGGGGGSGGGGGGAAAAATTAAGAGVRGSDVEKEGLKVASGLGAGTPPDTQTSTSEEGSRNDPMRELAVQAAGVALAKKKGPPVSVQGEVKTQASSKEEDKSTEEATVEGAEAGKGGEGAGQGRPETGPEGSGSSAAGREGDTAVAKEVGVGKGSDPVMGQVGGTTSSGVIDDDTKPETMTSAAETKEQSVEQAIQAQGDEGETRRRRTTSGTATKPDAGEGAGSIATAASGQPTTARAGAADEVVEKKTTGGEEAADGKEEGKSIVARHGTAEPTEAEGKEEEGEGEGGEETTARSSEKANTHAGAASETATSASNRTGSKGTDPSDEKAVEKTTSASVAAKVEAEESSEKVLDTSLKQSGDAEAAGARVED